MEIKEMQKEAYQSAVRRKNCIIVLLSLSERMGIDIKQNLEAKLRYNSIRKD